MHRDLAATRRAALPTRRAAVAAATGHPFTSPVIKLYNSIYIYLLGFELKKQIIFLLAIELESLKF